MGASSSSDGTILKKKKVYKRLEPEKREKTRFDPLENSNFTSQHDASIDKVKYVVICIECMIDAMVFHDTYWSEI